MIWEYFAIVGSGWILPLTAVSRSVRTSSSRAAPSVRASAWVPASACACRLASGDEPVDPAVGGAQLGLAVVRPALCDVESGLVAFEAQLVGDRAEQLRLSSATSRSVW